MKSEKDRHSKSQPKFFIPIKSNISTEIKKPSFDSQAYFGSAREYELNSCRASLSNIKTHRVQPLQSERNPRLSTNERNLFGSVTSLRSSHKFSLHGGLNSSIEKKPEKPLLTLTSGSTVFHNEKPLKTDAGDSYFPQRILDDEQDKRNKKILQVSKRKKQLTNFEYADPDLNLKLKTLNFYFQKVHAEGSQNSYLTDILLELENTVYSILNHLTTKQRVLHQSKTDLDKQSRDMMTKANQTETELKIKFQSKIQEMEKLKLQLEKDAYTKNLKNNTAEIEIQKLESQNQFLQSEINKLIKIFGFQSPAQVLEDIQIKNDQKIQQVSKIVEQKDTLVARYEILYSQSRKANEVLDKAHKELQIESTLAKSSLQDYKQLSEKLQVQNNLFYERSMMLLADYEGLTQRLASQNEELKQLQERFIFEETKKQKNKDSQAQREIQAEEDFLQESNSIKLIKQIYSSTMGPGLQLSLLPSKESETGAEIDLKNFMIAKPTYDQLFLDIKESEVAMNRVIDVNFIATLRAMYDSLFNELLYLNDERKLLAFPDFVYSWLGKFKLDQTHRRVRRLDLTDPDPDVARLEILHHLQTKISSRLWDCIIFQEFLNEIHTKDDLVYFLRCRNIVFQGPQLNDPSATFTFVHFIHFDWAEKIVKYLMSPRYENHVVVAIIQRLKERAKTKNKILLIDSAFLLRILMEEYKNMKREKIKSIRSILSKEIKAKLDPLKPTIGFNNFKNFLNSFFSESSDGEKSEIYRKCWVINRGSITVDSIVTVLNEECFFSKDSRKLCLKKVAATPVNSKNENQSKAATPALIPRVKEKISRIHQVFVELKEFAYQFGVENLITNLQLSEKYLGNVHPFQIDVLSSKEQYQLYSSFICHLADFNRLSSFSHQDLPEGLPPHFNEQYLDVLTGFKNIPLENFFLKPLDVKEFEINHKAKTLQKFFKTKLSGWYKLMSSLLKTKIRGHLNKKSIQN